MLCYLDCLACRATLLLQGLSSAACWHALLFCRPNISMSFTGDGCCLVSWPSNRFILDSGLEVLQASLIVLRLAKTNRFESLWNQLFDFVALHSHVFFFFKILWPIRRRKRNPACPASELSCLLALPPPTGSAASEPPLDVISLS